MRWTESEEIASERAQILNYMENNSLYMVFSAALMWLVIFAVIGMTEYILYKNVSVSLNTIIAVVLTIIITFLQRPRNWHKPIRCTIVLEDQSIIIIDCKRKLDSFKYDEFVGYSLSEVTSGKLIMFGEKNGNNIAFGIPTEVSVNDIRKFLSGKIRELSKEELPNSNYPC